MIRTVSPLHSVLDRMATLSRAMDESISAPRNGASPWSPAADVLETANAWVVTMDLPGVPQEAVEVVFDRNTLTVRGTRERPVTEESRVAMQERVAGRFERSLRFPLHVDGEKIGAAFAHGVLTVTIPKSDSAKPRTIAITNV